MQQTIQTFYENFQNWGYFILFAYSLGGGYVGIVLAGILSSIGSMDIGLSILIAFIGNAFGSSVLTFLGRYQKNDILKYFAKHRRKLALVHIWMKKYGIWLIFVSKYIYGMKTIVPLAVGISKYNLKKYLILNIISCGLWAIVVGIVAFVASEFIKRIFEKINNIPYLMPVFFIIIALFLWLLLKKNSQKSTK